MRAYIKTYGCTLNQADTAIMEGLLSKSEIDVTQEGDKADVVLFNTCIVKKPTEQKIFYSIKQAALQGRRIVVAGCMSATRKQQILSIAPNATIMTPNNVHMVVEAVKSAAAGVQGNFDSKAKVDKSLFLNPKEGTIAKIAVNDGCLSSCSFCETKLARGPLKSFSEELIIGAIKKSVSMGAKEIQLTSQDMGAYGRDKGTGIVQLMEKIARLDGNFKVRIGMLNPEHMAYLGEGFIELMKDDKFYKFVHIPVQSGSDRVLSHMKRDYTIEEFKLCVDMVRKRMPEATIETDIIVGYPLESVEDFNATMKAISEIKPNVTNISKFSPRPGTPAGRMKQLSNIEVSRRCKELSRKVRALQHELNETMIGKRFNVVITEKTEVSSNGRTPSYKQVVIPGEERGIGSTIDTYIYAASANVLYGREAQ
jgi:MiaB-like tRNA modifying enzyme